MAARPAAKWTRGEEQNSGETADHRPCSTQDTGITNSLWGAARIVRFRTRFCFAPTSCSLTPHAFQLPLHFDLEAYVGDALRVMRGKPVTVELLFDKATTARVKDRTWHPSQTTAPEKGGRLRMTLTVAATPELVGWLLGFGGGVTILGPPELKDAVRTAAEQILHKT